MTSQIGRNLGLWQLEWEHTAVTSDATTRSSDAVAPAMPVRIDGYSMASCIVIVDSFLDSDTTVTPTFQKNTTSNVRATQNDSDFSDIAAGSAITCTGDSDSNEIRGYYIDLVKAGLSTGLLRTSLIASDSDTAAATVLWLLTKPSQRMPDTDAITWAEIAS